MTMPLRLRLQAPRRVAAGSLSLRGVGRQRQAVRIRLLDEQGGVGLGESVPLPGYSRDDARAVERVLHALAARLSATGLQLPPGAGGPGLIAAALAPHADLLSAAPGATFALECALLDLLARRAGLSAAAWLAEGRALQAVPVSVLLPDDAQQAVAEAEAAAARGHGVLKLKVARSDCNAESEDHLLAAVRRAADAGAGRPGRVRLRLDANGGLPPAHAVARLAAWQRHGIELVEEPVPSAALSALLPLPLPWGADESLADPAWAAVLLQLPADRRPAAWVLKPAQLGLVRCLALAQAATRQGLGVIVTHSFDADLGHAAACAMAAALPAPPWPCGLAPHPGLRLAAAAVPVLPPPRAAGLGVPDPGDAAA
jgi:L-alanine-DL-glutamate epimerase-like enolase superfamily enzyme